METKKLTREQAMHHRLIWRYVVQHFDECDVYSLKTRAIKKYSIHVALDVNCILCDVYKNDGCQGCPLSKGEKRCYNSDMLYDLVNKGNIEAAKAIRDIELNVKPKNK